MSTDDLWDEMSNKKRKPLSDEEVFTIIAAELSVTDDNLRGSIYLVCRAIEAAHGIEEK